MSTELRDLRAKIFADDDQVLEAVSMATGKEKSELVREIVHEWAGSKLREVQLIVRLLPSACEGCRGRPGDKS